MGTLAVIVRIALAAIALRGVRWAYVAFILVSLAYFPAHVGFHLHPRACQLTFNASLAAYSLTNFPHIVLFALFFVFSSAQTGKQPSDTTVLLFASLATLAMGALAELPDRGSPLAHQARLRSNC